MTSFKEFARACKVIEGTPGSLDMTALVAELLVKVTPEELPVVTHFVMGEIFPAWSSEEIGVGAGILYSALAKSAGLSVADIKEIVRETGDIGETAVKALKKVSSGQATFSSFMEDSSDLSILEVYERFQAISKTSGKGSQTSKMKNLQYLFNSASSEEVGYIARISVEELRIGVGEGIARDAISKAFDVPSDEIERAFMLTNDLGLVAVTAREGGRDAVQSLGLELNRPIRMMLAQVTPDFDIALSDLGTAAVEWKFDGARVQIHKEGDNITLFSRRLENITDSLPDIVEAVRENIDAESAILDGEAVAIDENGRPRAFQDILKRFRRKYDVQSTAREIPLILNLFDIMYLNGEELLDLPLVERRAKLEGCVRSGDKIRVDTQYITDDLDKIMEIYNEALKAGHEGVMIKNPQSPYSPGKRGKNWLKKKPVMETLDLVVIGAEWGYGRRTSFLGSYALACHDPDTGRFLPVGRVATGFSDEQLAELTDMFSDLIVTEAGTEVEIKPEVIFEVAFEEIQKSVNYDSGYALRFPRLVNVRSDKSIEDVETIGRLEEMYLVQRERN
ncbi:MAG: ligase 1 [Methanolobus sp.]|jgi:DNA ligase-1|uniref:ATP-dependent DNA ligase n=1 Tax=Methanolobus sp. TaxID=1874737 RepID=UPI0024ABBC61|nr:ATP-dependent DNA ligase [Methanolobus sp.]MDI3485125.1 ligase 1 [Methanolobus sp.]MDK2830543.1 ligase 1 [Methanolobus sp.]